MIFISSTCLEFDPLDEIALLLRENLCHVEFSGGGRYHPIDEVRRGISEFLEFKLNTHVRIHNYFPSPEKSIIMNFAAGGECEIRESLSIAERALGLCSEFAIPYYSIHPGYLPIGGQEDGKGHFDFDATSVLSYSEALSNFLANFARLHELAKKREVRLALENLFPRHGVIDSLNNTFEEFDDILSALPEDVLILLDLGHLNVSATTLGFDKFDYLDKLIRRYGDRIVETHISGNDGSDDQHLPIDESDWQLDALTLLRGLPGLSSYGVDITLEARRLPIKKIRKILNLLEKPNSSI